MCQCNLRLLETTSAENDNYTKVKVGYLGICYRKNEDVKKQNQYFNVCMHQNVHALSVNLKLITTLYI